MFETQNDTQLLARSKMTNTCWVALGALVITALGSFYLYSENKLPFALNLLVLLDAIIIVTLTLLTYFLSQNTYIHFTQNGFELIKGQKSNLYLYSDFLGSDVTRNYHSGIYVGTTRILKLKGVGTAETEINCSGIGKQAFTEIVAQISQNNILQNHAGSISEDYFKQPKSFFIPKEDIVKSTKNQLLLTSVLVAIAACALIGYMIYGHLANIESFSIASAILSLVIAGFATYFIRKSWKEYQQILTIPTQVTVDATALTIDGMILNPESISSISMVPDSYTILTRDFLILLKDGRKLYYGFGKNDNNQKLTYNDYGKLCNVIKSWCLLNGIHFQSILG